jgi:hypothetical protein
MKIILPVVFLSLLSACVTAPEPSVIVVQPSWQSQPIKIVQCRPLVQYQARGFSFKGADIPIPQVPGGTVKFAGFDYTAQTLNTLYYNVAILDGLRLGYCGDRVAAAQTSQAAFQACNERIMQQEDKIAYLAMSTQQGEAAVQEAIHKYGTSSPAAATPDNQSTKKVDNAAAANVKQKAEAAASSATSASSPAPALSPGSSVSAALPAPVAAAVKSVPTATLLKMARQPAPAMSSMGH